MARLPQPGSDEGQWGDILNTFLSQVHKPDGTLKNSSVTAPVIADGAIAETKLAPAVQAKINTVTGTQGATGPEGPAGTAGTQGATGPQGPAGAPGATGPAGASGTPGTAGATGATGPEGPAGADGTSVNVAGSVASSAALPTNLTSGDAGTGYLTSDNGHLHVWSGTSWTDVGEIRGPQGLTGATGPQGAPGTPGTPGVAGASGAPGATGPAGTPGTNGSVGATGATGATGPQGASGTSTWNGITDKPAVIAAGVTEVAARTAVGAIGSSDLSGTWGVIPSLYWNGTSWPSRSLPSGYSGAVIWDSSTDSGATAPSAAVDGDRWLRRVS